MPASPTITEARRKCRHGQRRRTGAIRELLFPTDYVRRELPEVGGFPEAMPSPSGATFTP